LRNIVERAMILSHDNEVGADNLPEEVRDFQPEPEQDEMYAVDPSPTGDQLVTLRELEELYIQQVLSATGHNKTHAAKILGIHPTSLLRRLKKAGLNGKEELEEEPAAVLS
jgi:DNA-binding NtrC family response regulator